MSEKKANESPKTYMGVNMPTALAKSVKIEAIKDEVTIQTWLIRLIEKELSRRGVQAK